MITFDEVSKVYPDGTVAVDKLTLTAPNGKITLAENVVPRIKTAKKDDTATKTLDDVSAKLTAEDLISMNAEAATGTNLSDIAKKWLADAGIAKG